MPGFLDLTIADADTRISNNYTAVHIYRSLTEAGTYTLVGAVTLVSGQTAYEYYDYEGSGSHYYKTASWGSVPGEDSLSSAFQATDSNPYTTISAVKSQIKKTGTDRDAALATFIDAASRAIDFVCNRPDGFLAISSATARNFMGRGEPYLRIPECVSVSSVAMKETRDASTYTALASTDWLVAAGQPDDATFHETPYTMLILEPDGDYYQFTDGRSKGFRGVSVPTVQITARWGNAVTIPPAIVQVCLTQVVRWNRRSESAWSNQTSQSQFGNLPFQTNDLDPDLKFMLTRWIKPELG